ncbi:glycosyltransferase family 2 protein [Candidatus Beckwithbacteria bacterium]|nr:glycosyltransferase family 2 protein [Candidatus Beckwithbacteria bacterium]
MKKIGIILLNYNGLADTLDCLQSLAKIKQTGFSTSIFVVDYSKDVKESEQIKKQFYQIKLIRKESNLGFAKGNNVGIAEALKWGADYVLLLNSDTIVSSDFLQKLFIYLKKNHQVGAVSPKIYFAKGFEFHKEKYAKSDLGKVIWYAGGQIDWANMLAFHRGVDEVDHGQFDKILETDFISGCCSLIRKEVLEQVGDLNEKLFLYFEDTDWSQRVKKAGWKLKYYPKAHIWHKNAGGSGVGSSLQDYFITRNRLWFGFVYAPWRTKFALCKQSLLQLVKSNYWTKQGVKDFYLGNMKQGSWKGK